MANGDAVADVGTKSMAVDVDDGAVLDVGALANSDLIHVATHDAAVPHTAARTDLDVADDHRRRCDEGVVSDFRHHTAVGQYMVRHANSFLRSIPSQLIPNDGADHE